MIVTFAVDGRLVCFYGVESWAVFDGDGVLVRIINAVDVELGCEFMSCRDVGFWCSGGLAGDIGPVVLWLTTCRA